MRSRALSGLILLLAAVACNLAAVQPTPTPNLVPTIPQVTATPTKQAAPPPPSPTPQGPPPTIPAGMSIAEVLAQVDADRLMAHVETLAAIHSRHVNSTGSAAAAAYIRQQFEAIDGLAVILDEFPLDYNGIPTTQVNVIATLTGSSPNAGAVLIGAHYDPTPLFTHFWHWFELARMDNEPNASPIRRNALLYNIFDSGNEGTATGVEEMFMHAGLYDDSPRSREIVWIMLAQRCARGLASLYAQANEFDLKQAKAFQVEWTPRGWMRPDLDLLGFEQQLYLRQPGYGTSYVTGKYLIERTIMERSRQLGDAFSLRRFFDEFNAAGMMPVSLIYWQLTGQQMH